MGRGAHFGKATPLTGTRRGRPWRVHLRRVRPPRRVGACSTDVAPILVLEKHKGKARSTEPIAMWADLGKCGRLDIRFSVPGGHGAGHHYLYRMAGFVFRNTRRLSWATFERWAPDGRHAWQVDHTEGSPARLRVAELDVVTLAEHDRREAARR